MVSLVSYTGKDPTGSSKGCAGGSTMEDATMVSPSPIIEQIFTTDPNLVISLTQEEFIMPSGSSTTGCLATVTHHSRTGGLSE